MNQYLTKDLKDYHPCFEEERYQQDLSILKHLEQRLWMMKENAKKSKRDLIVYNITHRISKCINEIGPGFKVVDPRTLPRPDEVRVYLTSNGHYNLHKQIGTSHLFLEYFGYEYRATQSNWQHSFIPIALALKKPYSFDYYKNKLELIGMDLYRAAYC